MRVTYLRTSIPRPVAGDQAISRQLGQRLCCEPKPFTDKGMRLLGFEREGLQLAIPFVDIRRK